MRAANRLFAQMVGGFAKKMAVFACGAASAFGGYQTKEPKNIFKTAK